MRARLKLTFSVVFALGASIPFSAESRARETANSCGESFQSLMACLGKNSPRQIRNEAQQAESSLRLAVASERINPILNVQGLKASSNDPSGDSVQSSLLFAYDLHGTRGMRREVAQQEATGLILKNDLSKFEFLNAQFIALHRIRQITLLAQIQKTILESLQTTLRTFKRRPRLSSEQEASVVLLDLAIGEIQTRIVLQEQDKHAMEHDIEIQIGEEWAASAQNLPGPRITWPKISAAGEVHPNSLLMLQVSSNQKLSEASAESAERERYPLPLLGPSAEWSHLGPDRGVRVGFSLQIPLGVMESHLASRNLRDGALALAKVQAGSYAREILGEFNHSREIYQYSVKALEGMKPAEFLMNQLGRIDGLFRRGLIPGSAYTESLRQTISLLQAHDELELKALDSYCKIKLAESNPRECFL